MSVSEYSLPTDEQPTGGPASEQGEAVDGAAGLSDTAFAPSTEAGTAAADLEELGLGGVEGPSGYLDDAAPEGEPTPAASFSDAPQVASEVEEALSEPAADTEPVDAAAVDEAAPAEPEYVSDDPSDEMRRALTGLPGDWYVVHSYAGYENKVKTNLESRISSLNMEDYIFQIEVPTEEVMEVKG
ncbi:MAG: transcription termination/antitermination protein NusG, partial [Actinomycetota bacterium]|nr:transcription termination/antitermination protein NusG [Actinomycetota bacterium]